MRNVLKMTQKDREALFINKRYSKELCDPYDWKGAYPVVSNGFIIAIYDMWCGEPPRYAKKPIINNEYMDADAEDVKIPTH